jgi:hypothetical protein
VRQLPFAARTGRRHRHREGLFGGQQTFDEPTFTVKGANITPDPDSGIGKWSADDRAGIQQWICGVLLHFRFADLGYIAGHIDLDHFHSAAGSYPSKSARNWEAHADSFMPKVRANE